MADYHIPGAELIDGITLNREEFPIVYKEKIDERPLTRDNDILVATYPRTGENRRMFYMCNIIFFFVLLQSIICDILLSCILLIPLS